MSELGRLQLKPKGARPYFFDDPAVDKLLAIITALAGEVSVIHDEYDSLVRVLESKGVVSAEELKNFIPNADVRASRDEWREIFLENVLRIIHQEIEGIQKENEMAYEDSIDLVENK